MPAVHPEPARLNDFVHGKLDPPAIDAIEQHLSACDSCCDTLRQLQGDTFAGLVKEAGRERQPNAATLSLATMPTAAAGPVGVPAELIDHPRYRVVELLGVGGMGAVFLAEHRLMERTVAVKTINPRLVASPSAVERFRREVRAAGQLHHPNIVTSHDADQAGDLHFFVMEHVRGTDLNRLLEQRGPLPVAEACEYVRQAALGLQNAHEHGMTHRDIKPHNLMVVPGPTPQVKILDFGLASLTADALPAESDTNEPGAGLTGAGALMGTPDYMAPEQARDAHTADIRADVYSLGCTLYTLLSGKVPFPGGTVHDKLEAHMTRSPKPLTNYRKDLPPGLARVIDRMMAKDPAQRYQTPGDVAEALAPFTVAAVPRSRKRLAVVAALATAALLALASVVYVKTNNGELKIESAVDDVQVVVSREGTEVEVIDLKSGTTVKRLPTGGYDIKLKGDRTDVTVEGGGFTMKRGGQVVVQVKQVVAPPKPRRTLSPTDEIAPPVRAAIDKGLAYLVKSQHPDGHWTAPGDQYPTSMTALAGMALLMEGSTPDSGPYAEPLRKAVDWLVARSRPDGLLGDSRHPTEAGRYMFGHGYAMLFLSSVYALEPDGERRQKLHDLLTKAVEFTGACATPRGGWGYVSAKEGNNFDESCTTIVQLHGLRAARNAGITVPRGVLDVDLLRKSTNTEGGVVYSLSTGPENPPARPPLTAAALCVAEFDTVLTKKWLAYCQKTLAFDGRPQGFEVFTHYYYAQAIYLLGETGYARLVPDSKPADRLTWSGYKRAQFDRMVKDQAADGSWTDKLIGPVYATACHLTILQLDTAAVPIYRR